MVLVSDQCGIASWPNINKGIFLIENGESLTDAIRRIIRLNVREREERADIAQKISLAFNTQTINQWLNIFDEIVHKPLLD